MLCYCKMPKGSLKRLIEDTNTMPLLIDISQIIFYDFWRASMQRKI